MWTAKMDNLFNHIKHVYINLLVVWDLISTSNNHQTSKQLKKRLDCAIINKWKNKGGSDFWKCHLHLIYSKKIHINWLYWEGIGHLFPDLKPWELDDFKKTLVLQKTRGTISFSRVYTCSTTPY